MNKFKNTFFTLITDMLDAVDDTDESDVDEDNKMDFYM